jgi:uncharacterized damage-inducible protein DinB
MAGNAPSTSTEKDALLAFLVQQRDGLRYAAFGLTEGQLRSRPARSALSVGGLIKHGALTERSWIRVMSGQSAMGESGYVDSFALSEDESLETLLALQDEVAAETASAVEGLQSLEIRVRLPPAPWFPDHPEGYQARWILLHLVEELARHAGHADIIREQLDGATMYSLMAGAEGWPETEWVKPWRPSPHG